MAKGSRFAVIEGEEEGKGQQEFFNRGEPLNLPRIGDLTATKIRIYRSEQDRDGIGELQTRTH